MRTIYDPIITTNVINIVFQKFISIFSQKEHPLVLFLDDLQWADRPSVQLLEALIEDIDSAPVSEREKPLFHYLKKITLSASKLTESDAKAVYQAGWTEEDLHDLILVACLFNFYNRLLDGHGVKGSPAIYQFGADHLHKKGYSVPWFIGFIKSAIKKSKLKALRGAEA